MSRVSVKHGAQTGFESTLQNLADVGPRLMTLSAESGRSFAKEATSFARDATTLLSAALPKIQIATPKIVPLCDIPETECPPHCVCEIDWHACPQEKLQATITVTNTGKVARVFHFTATPIQGPGNPPAAVQFTPANANLAPNQSVTVQVVLAMNNQFQAGQTYTGEILINGAYEQCVRLTIHVDPDERPHCDVKQGEIPVRVRAHRWYDHFQCAEPCEQPSHTVPGGVGVNNPGGTLTPGGTTHG